MKKLLFLGLIFSAMSIYSLAQERIITGKVFHKNDIQLPYVQVCQPNSHNFNFTDNYGVFHLVVNEKLDKNMIISLEGFTTKTIAIDSAKSYYSIELVRDTTHILSEINGVDYRSSSSNYHTYTQDNSNIQKFEPQEKTALEAFVRLDMIFNDFQSFTPLLGESNIYLLNEFTPMSVFGLNFKYHRFSYGLGFGFQDNTDSTEFLDLNLYEYQYALHFGYDILNSKHFAITPMVQLKWYIFNLHNSDWGDNIPLEQYLTYKELDIKFNQLTGFVGCNLSYKTGISYGGLGNIGVGVYGGYIFKLSDKPWIYSEENYLRTDKKIDIKNLNFGLYFMLYSED